MHQGQWCMECTLQMTPANFACRIVSDLMYFTFDRIAGLCQAMPMLYAIRKFVAVILAIWLPLFSGNALAVSVAMQAMSGGNAVVAQESEHCLHHASAVQHPQSSAANQDQSAGLQDQQDSSCGSSGICHLACCGYMATVSITVVEAQPFAMSYAPFSTHFQSIALIPLDPPPLARV